MRILLVLSFIFIAGLLIAQEKDKAASLSEKKIQVDVKLKSPGLFSKVDSGKILILKIRNLNSEPKTVSFGISEFINGMSKANSENFSNCLNSNKKKKLKIHLANFQESDQYDWTYTDVKVTTTETCP